MTITEALQILELSLPVSRDELKRAYREAMLVWHPDRFGTNADLKAKAEARTYKINEAFALLRGIPDSAFPFRNGAGGHAQREEVPPSTPPPSRPPPARKTTTSKHAERPSTASPPQFDEKLNSLRVGLRALVVLMAVMAALYSVLKERAKTEEPVSTESDASRETIFVAVVPEPPVEPDSIELEEVGTTTTFTGRRIIELHAKAGQDAEGNLGNSFLLLKRLSESGSTPLHAYACHLVGLLCIHGKCAIALDYGEALKALGRAARLGYAESQYQLGCLFRDGHGTDVNLEEAYLWFAAAKESGDNRAGEAMQDQIFSDRSLAWKAQMLTDAKSRLQAIRDGIEFGSSSLGGSDRLTPSIARFPDLLPRNARILGSPLADH